MVAFLYFLACLFWRELLERGWARMAGRMEGGSVREDIYRRWKFHWWEGGRAFKGDGWRHNHMFLAFVFLAPHAHRLCLPIYQPIYHLPSPSSYGAIFTVHCRFL